MGSVKLEVHFQEQEIGFPETAAMELMALLHIRHSMPELLNLRTGPPTWAFGP